MSTPLPKPTTIGHLLEAPYQYYQLKRNYDYAVWDPLFLDLNGYTPSATTDALVAAPPQGVVTITIMVHDNTIDPYVSPFRFGFDRVACPVTNDDGLIFTFRGDVRQGFAPKLVKLDTSLFAANLLNGVMHSLAADALEQQYALDGADELMGKVTKDTAGGMELSTRRLMLVPVRHAKQFWNFPREMSFVHFWRVVYPLMKPDPDSNTYSGFYNGLRLAATAQATYTTLSILKTVKPTVADTSAEVEDLALC